MQIINIPIWFTLFRIITIPFFILFFYSSFRWGTIICALIFIIAAITDWLDGFLARRWGNTTRLGAFLDPIADKIMVSMALVLLTEHFHSWWITLPSSAMIIREIIISALREWMAEIGKSNNIAVSSIGKIKTTVQLLAVAALLWSPHRLITEIGVLALYIAVIFTFWSMFNYLYNVRHYIFN